MPRLLRGPQNNNKSLNQLHQFNDNVQSAVVTGHLTFPGQQDQVQLSHLRDTRGQQDKLTMLTRGFQDNKTINYLTQFKTREQQDQLRGVRTTRPVTHLRGFQDDKAFVGTSNNIKSLNQLHQFNDNVQSTVVTGHLTFPVQQDQVQLSHLRDTRGQQDQLTMLTRGFQDNKTIN